MRIRFKSLVKNLVSMVLSSQQPSRDDDGLHAPDSGTSLRFVVGRVKTMLRNRPLKIILPVMVFLTVCIVLWLFGGSAKDVRNYKINKGEFIATLNETGELEAVNSRIVSIPYIGWKYGWQMKLVELVEHGTQVSMGDSIAQIDRDGVLKFLVEQQNRLETEQANLNKLIVQHKSTVKALETELASSRAVLNLNKIQLDKYEFESEKKKEIKKLEYERELIRYNKAEKNYQLTQVVLENELKIQKIKIFQLENDINDAYTALTQLTIRSPLNGMMQLLENRRTNQTVKVGDELYQGGQFACVPDMSRMKVKSTVNETDIGKIQLNAKVMVRLDAFPSIPFEGTIIEIGRLSYKKDEKSRTKVFDFVVMLDKSDPILKPGMTVRCEIFIAQLDDVLYVSNDCIMKEKMKYYIFTGEKEDYEKCEIDIGPRNNEYTVIYGDFTKGQSVIPLSEVALNESAQKGI
ncbi:HlyD family efflux transporter periplasmic adaptor subunit [bacterium]|nr:HlyD family efflux transporter periplasmic adaptor subunit [bacterium]